MLVVYLFVFLDREMKGSLLVFSAPQGTILYLGRVDEPRSQDGTAD